MVKKPSAAGSFYPDDPKILEKKIKKLLDAAELVKTSGKLKILIVPHAGIDYSGRVAAWGFRQVKGRGYKKIVLLGVSHRTYFSSAAVFTEGEWETPLGKVSVEESVAEKIIDHKYIVKNEKPHELEHSLELEVIFLQNILSDFQIIPILVSNTYEALVEALSRKIFSVFDEQTLLIVSSDLSHYPAFDIAEKADNETIAAILEGKRGNFENSLKEIEDRYYQFLDTAACGQRAIAVALAVSEKLKIKNIIKIKYENSGEVTGEKERVVGYGAVGFYQ